MRSDRDASVPIAIAGMGIVTAAGRGNSATLRALRTGDVEPAAPRTIRSDLAVRYPVFEVPASAFDDPPMRLPGGRGRRGIRLARIAAGDAMAGLALDVDPTRFGVIAGVTVGGMNHTEDWVEGEVRGDRASVAARPALRHLPLWETSGDLASAFGLAGPSFAIVTACTGGAQAIACGAELIAAGVCDAVLAGGVDSISRLTYHGFASLRLLAERRCTPFDAARSGLNLGEGAAFLVLARADLVPAPLALVSGWGSTADAFHPTAPRPDGSGVAEAFRAALAMGGLCADDIGWVHAHGTATPTNDAVEAAAIRSVFADRPVLVSSTKHVFGHTLGAAGAVSTVVAALALREGFVPTNAPVEQPDSRCGVDIVTASTVAPPPRHVLVSSLGFGGASCALAVSRYGA